MTTGTISGTPSIIVGSFRRFSYLLLTSKSRLDKFLPHAEEFGFPLHVNNFKSSSLLAFPLGHPSPGLIHTVHLFGIHFLQQEFLHAQGVPLLKRAVQFVATDLLGSHPDKIIHDSFRTSLFSYSTLPLRLNMVNTVIVDRSPQAADPDLGKTTNSRSPDIQGIKEDIHEINKIYHFQNCGTVYMPVDSLNARGVIMENCGNNVPQVTCSLFFFSFSSNLALSYYLDHPSDVNNCSKDSDVANVFHNSAEACAGTHRARGIFEVG